MLFILLSGIVLIPKTVPAVMVDTRVWTICENTQDCTAVEGACDWSAVNRSYAPQARTYYRETQKLVECAYPGNMETRPIPECRNRHCVFQEKPVARIFDQIIYPSAIVPSQEILSRNRAQMTEVEFNHWNEEFQIRTLEYLIFSEAQNHLLEEAGLKPTESEIQAFIDFSTKKEKERLGELESQRKDLLRQLQADDLTENKKNMLMEYLNVTNQLISDELTRTEEEKAHPNFTQIKQKSMQNVAALTVTSWKFNKALYEKYGGRVIFQQAGCEPVDAYKKWLEEHLQATTIEISDPAFGHVFDRLFHYFEMPHTYIEKESADKYFARSWWDPAFEPL